MSGGALIWGWDGTIWRKVKIDAAGHLHVDVITAGGTTSRLYAYDTSNWQWLQVEAALLHNLRVKLYDGDEAIASEETNATFAESVRGLIVASCLYGFDGTNWRSALAFQSDADGQVTTAYSQRKQSYLYGFNETNWDRLRVDADKNLKVSDRFGGNIYSKTMLMPDDNPTRFEAASKLLRDVVIIVKDYGMLFGETGVVVYPVGAGETVGFTKVDISTLYFQNASAGDDATISILGVEE